MNVYLRNSFIFAIYPYLLIKSYWNLKNRNTYLSNLFAIFINIITLPLLLLILLISYLYTTFVELVLKLKIGNDFEGILSGIDGFITCYPELKGNICFLFLCKSKKSQDEFLQELRDHVENKFYNNDLPKRLYHVRKNFMGIIYNQKINSIKINEIVKPNSIIANSKEVLLNTLTKVIVEKLPMNNSFNWDLLSGSFYENSEKQAYIFIRIHHSVSDLLAMYNIITNLLCQNDYSKNIYAETFSKEPNKFSAKKFELRYMPSLLKPSDDFLFDNFRPHQGLISYIDDESKTYFKKVVAIKNHINNATVSLILMSSFVHSLKSMAFKKGLSNSIFKTLITSPYQRYQRRIKKYYRNDFIGEVRNNFFVISFHVRNGLENDEIEKTLLDLKDDMEKSFESCDKELIYIMENTLLYYLPNYILKRLGSMCSPLMIGVAPGGPKLTLFNGDELKNIVPMLPKYDEYGCLIYFYSYDGKLTLSINANENIFTKEEVDEILKNTYKNIDLLYEKYVQK